MDFLQGVRCPGQTSIIALHFLRKIGYIYTMRKKLLPLVALFFFPLLTNAQDRLIIRFSPFYTQGIGIEETRFIESLIQSYLSDAGDVINLFSDTAPAASDDRLPDFVVTGSIYLEREGRVFTLEIHNRSTGLTSRYTSIHSSASDLVLKARSLVETAFSAPVQAAAPVSAAQAGNLPERAEIMTENRVAGIWRGEAGIEMIRLQDGRGLAFFSSGAQMNLAYTIENNILRIRQISPNMERFYYPLPHSVARQLAEQAEPMRWEMALHSGGTHLRGTRISTEVRMQGNEIVELLPGTRREAQWVRIR